ncbi:hypothetical protein L2D01_14020 [Hyphomonadaceae bacterium ML37]|nr:hypothetical protein L2D01_14020 [Hyphomonadaceae bacterium ML37]
MHIILAILGALATVGVIIWRVRVAMEAARELSDLAGEAANLPRKMRFRAKARRGGFQTIDDPREAAAVLLYGAGACANPLSPEDKAALSADLAGLLEISAGDADELTARAAWHVNQLNDPMNAVSAMTDLIVQRAGLEALTSLIPVLDRAIDRSGPGTHEQTLYRDKILRRAGLR